MKNTKFNLITGVLLFLFLGAKPTFAQQIQVGAQVGALGTSSSDSGLGYGVFFAVIPYEQLGFVVDATFSDQSGSSYFSSSPSLAFYFGGMEELKLGVLGGGGFYKLEPEPLKFGLNAGVTLDFMLAPNLWVGSQARFHSIFNLDSASPVWNVFLNLSYTFSGADGGW